MTELCQTPFHSKFLRLSPDLLDLREREKHLIGSRRFGEAAVLHKEFERRQQQELQRQSKEYFEKERNKRTNVKQTRSHHIRNKQ
jgi:hypothetical protein